VFEGVLDGFYAEDGVGGYAPGEGGEGEGEGVLGELF